MKVLVSSGVYPIKPALPAVGGGEGVGIVREVGEKVTGMRIGDRVIPAGPALGKYHTSSECVLHLHQNELPLVVEHYGFKFHLQWQLAACFSSNDCLA